MGDMDDDIQVEVIAPRSVHRYFRPQVPKYEVVSYQGHFEVRERPSQQSAKRREPLAKAVPHLHGKKRPRTSTSHRVVGAVRREREKIANMSPRQLEPIEATKKNSNPLIPSTSYLDAQILVREGIIKSMEKICTKSFNSTAIIQMVQLCQRLRQHTIDIIEIFGSILESNESEHTRQHCSDYMAKMTTDTNFLNDIPQLLHALGVNTLLDNPLLCVIPLSDPDLVVYALYQRPWDKDKLLNALQAANEVDETRLLNALRMLSQFNHGLGSHEIQAPIVKTMNTNDRQKRHASATNIENPTPPTPQSVAFSNPIDDDISFDTVATLCDAMQHNLQTLFGTIRDKSDPFVESYYHQDAPMPTFSATREAVLATNDIALNSSPDTPTYDFEPIEMYQMSLLRKCFHSWHDYLCHKSAQRDITFYHRMKRVRRLYHAWVGYCSRLHHANRFQKRKFLLLWQWNVQWQRKHKKLICKHRLHIMAVVWTKWALFCRRNIAARIIQRVWIHRVRPALAAVVIQSTYRGHSFRLELWKQKCQINAITTIQSIYRGHHLRLQLYNERCQREALEKQFAELQRSKATVKIQSVFRGHSLRLVLWHEKCRRAAIEKQLAEIRCTNAAKKIQTKYREFHLRLVIWREQCKKDAMEKRLIELRSKNAIRCIQAIWHAFKLEKAKRSSDDQLRLLRKQYLTELSAFRVQNAWTKYKLYLACMALRKKNSVARIVLVWRHYKIARDQARSRCAIKIQKQWIAHRRYSLVDRFQQAVWSYLLIQINKKKCRNATRIQAIWKKHKARLSSKIKCAQVIQHRWKLFRLRLSSVLRIQHAWRKHKESCEEKKLQVIKQQSIGAKRIQSIWRNYYRRYRSSQIIQSLWRNVKQRRNSAELYKQERCRKWLQIILLPKYLSVITENISRQHLSARLIQHCFRRYYHIKCQSYSSKALNSIIDQIDCSQRVQRSWRAYKYRIQAAQSLKWKLNQRWLQRSILCQIVHSTVDSVLERKSAAQCIQLTYRRYRKRLANWHCLNTCQTVIDDILQRLQENALHEMMVVVRQEIASLHLELILKKTLETNAACLAMSQFVARFAIGNAFVRVTERTCMLAEDLATKQFAVLDKQTYSRELAQMAYEETFTRHYLRALAIQALRIDVRHTISMKLIESCITCCCSTVISQQVAEMAKFSKLKSICRRKAKQFVFGIIPSALNRTLDTLRAVAQRNVVKYLQRGMYSAHSILQHFCYSMAAPYCSKAIQTIMDDQAMKRAVIICKAEAAYKVRVAVVASTAKKFIRDTIHYVLIKACCKIQQWWRPRYLYLITRKAVSTFIYNLVKTSVCQAANIIVAREIQHKIEMNNAARIVARTWLLSTFKQKCLKRRQAAHYLAFNAAKYWLEHGMNMLIVLRETQRKAELNKRLIGAHVIASAWLLSVFRRKCKKRRQVAFNVAFTSTSAWLEQKVCQISIVQATAYDVTQQIIQKSMVHYTFAHQAAMATISTVNNAVAYRHQKATFLQQTWRQYCSHQYQHYLRKIVAHWCQVGITRVVDNYCAQYNAAALIQMSWLRYRELKNNCAVGVIASAWRFYHWRQTRYKAAVCLAQAYLGYVNYKVFKKKRLCACKIQRVVRPYLHRMRCRRRLQTNIKLYLSKKVWSTSKENTHKTEPYYALWVNGLKSWLTCYYHGKRGTIQLDFKSSAVLQALFQFKHIQSKLKSTSSMDAELAAVDILSNVDMKELGDTIALSMPQNYHLGKNIHRSESLAQINKTKVKKVVRSVLESAVSLNISETFESLSAGREVNERNVHGQSPLHLVILLSSVNEDKQWGMIDFLLDNRADINAQDYDGITPLMLVAGQGSLFGISTLLSRGARINSTDNKGFTAFHHACAKNQPKAMTTLMEAAMMSAYNVHQASYDGMYPLHIISILGLTDCAYIIQDTNVNIRDGAGRTPLQLGIVYNHIAIVKFLLEIGADPNIRDHLGRSAMHYAVESSSKSIEMVSMLRQHFADLDASDARGDTALHWAAQSGKQKLVHHLINLGADVGLHNTDWDTAYDVAVNFGHANCAQQLSRVRPIIKNNHTASTPYITMYRMLPIDSAMDTYEEEYFYGAQKDDFDSVASSTTLVDSSSQYFETTAKLGQNREVDNFNEISSNLMASQAESSLSTTIDSDSANIQNYTTKKEIALETSGEAIDLVSRQENVDEPHMLSDTVYDTIVQNDTTENSTPEVVLDYAQLSTDYTENENIATYPNDTEHYDQMLYYDQNDTSYPYQSTSYDSSFTQQYDNTSYDYGTSYQYDTNYNYAQEDYSAYPYTNTTHYTQAEYGNDAIYTMPDASANADYDINLYDQTTDINPNTFTTNNADGSFQESYIVNTDYNTIQTSHEPEMNKEGQLFNDYEWTQENYASNDNYAQFATNGYADSTQTNYLYDYDENYTTEATYDPNQYDYTAYQGNYTTESTYNTTEYEYTTESTHDSTPQTNLNYDLGEAYTMDEQDQSYEIHIGDDSESSRTDIADSDDQNLLEHVDAQEDAVHEKTDNSDQLGEPDYEITPLSGSQ